MVKHTQTIRRQKTNSLSAFDHFMGLALKGSPNSQKQFIMNLGTSKGIIHLVYTINLQNNYHFLPLDVLMKCYIFVKFSVRTKWIIRKRFPARLTLQHH